MNFCLKFILIEHKIDELEKEEALPAGENKDEEKKCEEGCTHQH